MPFTPRSPLRSRELAESAETISWSCPPQSFFLSINAKDFRNRCFSDLSSPNLQSKEGVAMITWPFYTACKCKKKTEALEEKISAPFKSSQETELASTRRGRGDDFQAVSSGLVVEASAVNEENRKVRQI